MFLDVNSGFTFEFDKKCVECLFCITNDNLVVFVLVLVLLFVLFNLLISILKDKFYIVRK